ncbi:hypothetical protein Ciccas_012459, partial [Cichlidogyrus casuarinus]
VSINRDVPPNTSQDNVRKLRRILAGKLDPDWTSDIQPRVLRQRGASSPNTPVDQNSDLFKESKVLNITLKDKDGLSYAISESQMQSFHEWLVEKASCEMEFIWDDLGAHFFPRWIRRGVCIEKPGQSCSWPPGMKCRPSGSKALQLLHWKCEDAANEETKKRAFGGDELDRIRRQVSFSPSAVLWQNSPSWHGKNRMTRAGPWRGRNGGQFTPEERELLRQRRARRLIKQLSVEDKGMLCYWQNQKYLVSDSCTCSCG